MVHLSTHDRESEGALISLPVFVPPEACKGFLWEHGALTRISLLQSLSKVLFLPELDISPFPMKNASAHAVCMQDAEAPATYMAVTGLQEKQNPYAALLQQLNEFMQVNLSYSSLALV